MKKEFAVFFLIAIVSLFILSGCSRTAKQPESQVETKTTVDVCKKIIPSISDLCPDAADSKLIFISPDQPYEEENLTYSGTGTGACIWKLEKDIDNENMKAMMLTVDIYADAAAAATALNDFAKESGIELKDNAFVIESHISDEVPIEHLTKGSVVGSNVAIMRQFALQPNNFFCSSAQVDQILEYIKKQWNI